jgi:NAD(P)-dependent dehydrogenase (short-subunit alcohol dehydrogenase family)
MRLEGKVAIVGAGQSPGEGIGNGRATTLRFAQEGARILAVDRLIASAEETAAMVTAVIALEPYFMRVASQVRS